MNGALVRSYMARGKNGLQHDCLGRCHEVFDMLDTDRSGVLSQEEFVRGAVASSLEIKHEEAIDAFNLMDFDCSGSLTRQEFVEGFVGLGIDPIHPDSADERIMLLKLASSLQSKSNATAHCDASLRHVRKLTIRRAAVRIQQEWRRHQNGGTCEQYTDLVAL